MPPKQLQPVEKPSTSGPDSNRHQPNFWCQGDVDVQHCKPPLLRVAAERAGAAMGGKWHEEPFGRQTGCLPCQQGEAKRERPIASDLPVASGSRCARSWRWGVTRRASTGHTGPRHRVDSATDLAASPEAVARGLGDVPRTGAPVPQPQPATRGFQQGV